MGSVVLFMPDADRVAVVVTGLSHCRRLRPLFAVLPPSETTVRKVTPGNVGSGSSLRITPLPVPFRMVTPAGKGEERFTKNVSFASTFVSCRTLTVTGSSTTPGLNVRVPPAGLRSAGDTDPMVAVPGAALKFTVTLPELGFDRVTRKTAGVGPEGLPSNTCLSLIEIWGSGSSSAMEPTACVSGSVALTGARVRS